MIKITSASIPCNFKRIKVNGREREGRRNWEKRRRGRWWKRFQEQRWVSEWKEGKGKECEGERVRNIYGIFNVAREIFIRDVCASFSRSLVDGRKM